MDNEFITNEIKNRKVIYYLTTKNDLDAIKSKSILADIFLTLFSVFLGIVFTIMITRESIKNLSPDLIIKFNIYFYVFSIVSAICFLFFIFYCCQHFRTIKEIILSGGHSSEDNALKAVKSLKIIEAVYFSEN